MTQSLDHSAIANRPQAVSMIFFGEPASKANSRRVVRFGGMSRLIKSEKALTYSEMFKQQAVPINPLLDGDLCITMHIYYSSRRPDLDESLILDLLQGVVYVNDRQVREKHIFWHLDKESPRTVITVTKKDPALGRVKKEKEK